MPKTSRGDGGKTGRGGKRKAKKQADGGGGPSPREGGGPIKGTASSSKKVRTAKTEREESEEAVGW